MDILRESFAGTLIHQVAPSLLRFPDEDSSYLQESGRLKALVAATPDDIVLCDWQDEDDPDNPLNWRLSKKMSILTCIICYALVVYMSAPIWTPGEQMFIQEFGHSHEYSSLGLALYVLGYGVGPLLFAPLSEIPAIGRNPPYIVTFTLFMLVTIPAALVRNAPAFMFFRFLQGFFGSPVLANGGASITDVFNIVYTPIALTVWSFACFVAPTIGPIIGGAAVPYLGWRFTMWEMLIASCPVLILLLFIPETSPGTILYYRAQRLRTATGNENIRSQSEIAQAEMSFQSTVYEALLIPAKATLQDPAILFTNIYLIFIYGIYYSFFESFPLVFQDMHGFDTLQMGLSYIPIAIGTLPGYAAYFCWLWFWRRRKILAGVQLEPEHILDPAVIAAFIPPIGLLLFGWLSRPDIPWIAPMIGVALFPCGVFPVFQNLHVYMANCYPKYAASLFAATDFTRAACAVGWILAGRPMFLALGIGGGSSFLAGLMIVCIFGVFALRHYGPALRKRSKFTAK